MEEKHHRHGNCTGPVRPVFADIPDGMKIRRFRARQAPECIPFYLRD